MTPGCIGCDCDGLKNWSSGIIHPDLPFKDIERLHGQHRFNMNLLCIQSVLQMLLYIHFFMQDTNDHDIVVFQNIVEYQMMSCLDTEKSF